MSRLKLLAPIVAAALLGLWIWWLPTPTQRDAHTAGNASGAASFAVINARVFDGQRFLEDTDVLVEDGKISAVGPNLDRPAGTSEIDATGQTLLPGLIDAHVHVFGDALQTALRFGVTTELDMFSPPDGLAESRRRRDELGPQEVADLWSAGILATAPGGHGTEYGLHIPTLTGPGQAREFVDARLSEGSDYLKIIYDDGHVFGKQFPTLDIATVSALVEAAHDRGLMAVVHVSSEKAAMQVIDAGADGLAHVFGDEPATDELIGRMKDSGAFVITTLSVLESVAGIRGGAAMASDPRLSPFIGPAERQNLEAGFGAGLGKSFLARAEDNVQRLYEAGVPVLAGTDAPNPGTAHGVSIHRELELLHDAGLGNAEALAAATSVPARVFGLDDRGRIAKGMIADLVLVNGDPESDITATRDIARVFKDGRLVGRAPPDSPEAAPPAPEDARISDFDGGVQGSKFRLAARFGFGWQITTDAMRGGKSTADFELVSPGAGGSSGALAVSGEVRSGFLFPWAGIIYFPAETPMGAVNFSSKTTLAFQVRGDGGTYSVMLFSGAGQPGMPARVSFDTSSEWRRVVIPLDEFEGADPAHLRGLAFTAGPAPGKFAFAIDEVAVR